jgi:hypothetical protein
LGPEDYTVQLKQLAADTRDPIATLAFSLLGIAGALGWIPDDLDPNVMAEIVGFLMAATAALFSLLHHKSFKQAMRAGAEALDRAAAPDAPVDDQATPLEPVDDGR